MRVSFVSLLLAIKRTEIARRVAALAMSGALLVPLLAPGEPWAASVQWEHISGADWLLRDSMTLQPVALAKDPKQIIAGSLPGVIQATEHQAPQGLSVVTVHDRLPEFWAQPAVWNSFQRGPSAYAGTERDVEPDDWAGRQASDRRAYAFDQGRRRSESLARSVPVFGAVQLERHANGLSLNWPGVPGRLYVLETTDSLSKPFQTMQVYGAVEQGNVSVSLPAPVGGESYYRIKEVGY